MEARRRQVQSARDKRASGGSGGGTTNAPLARNVTLGSSAPRYASTPNGLLVSHSERLFPVMVHDSAERNMTFPVVPSSFPWLGDLVEGYQHFTIKSMTFQYRPRVGAAIGGTVIMAPYYEADDPRSRFGYGNGISMMDWVSSLPGAKQFANWASESAGFLAKNLVRSVFRVIGVETRPGSPPVPFDDESRVPGWICVVTSPRSDGVANAEYAGDVWATYTVELRATRGMNQPKGITFYAGSTVSLGLTTTALASGSLSHIRPHGADTVRCFAPGTYCVIKRAVGTTLTYDTDGDTVQNIYGVDVTADRFGGVYDVSAGVITDTVLPNTQQLFSTMAIAGPMQAYFVNLIYGDELTLSALSGTAVTNHQLYIFKCQPGMPMVA